MKTLEELNEMAKAAINTNGSKEGNFLSYEVETEKIWLHSEYADAKRFVEKGGQVLVIDKQKVYTYKVKNDEEYERYVANEVRQENIRKMNCYGI